MERVPRMMVTHTFEKLMKSIFFKDDVRMISDTVCVVSLHDPSMGGHGVFTVESAVEGIFQCWAEYKHVNYDFTQAIADDDYELLIDLVDAERGKIYAEREAMKLARSIADVSDKYHGLPASKLEGVTDETLAHYRDEYGGA